MLTDPREQALAAAFKAARPLPREGWEARALAAVAGVHPRRHPNLLTYIIVAALILLLAAGLFAAVRYFFVEGTLHFHDIWYDADGTRERRAGHFLSGELRWQTEGMPSIRWDLSPVSDECVSWRRVDASPTMSDSHRSDIFRSSLDGSNEVNLTEAAGVGGINCKPEWSPDGSMILFQHCDAAEGVAHCGIGFDVWVMNADGTDAHQVIPEGTPHTWDASWSPDGSLLLTLMGDTEGWSCETIATDIWGTDIRDLPNVGVEAVSSPDGSTIASCKHVEDQVDGEPGRWNQLLLTDADGSDPRVLVRQFVVYADVEARYPTEWMLEQLPRLDWVRAVAHMLGPTEPRWSPSGDKIAFLAALPFDPAGLYFLQQREVWVYDLTTDELIRVTDDDVGQTSLSWK